MTESQIQSDIIQLLKLAGFIVIRMNAGKGAHNLRLAPAGTPDLLVLGHGLIFWIEVKTATGKVSTAQAKMHAYLRANGLIVHVCRSVADCENILKNLHKKA